MRAITAEKLKDILAKHKKWLNDEEGGEQADLRFADLYSADLQCANLQGADLYGANLRHVDLRCANLRNVDLRGANLRHADLRCANLRCANLRNVDLYSADLQGAKRPWLLYIGAIGSRGAETICFVDYDNIRCGCWNDYQGGTLAEFKARIDKVYPSNSENEEYQRYRIECLSAIKMFESMREAYLKSAGEEKDNEDNI